MMINFLDSKKARNCRYLGSQGPYRYRIIGASISAPAAVHSLAPFLEREVAATRAGVANADGAVAQVGVSGVAAAAFDHWDSRSGDPQLHTHVVIANKVKTLLDGRWRSLDSRPMHAAVVALSAHYNAVLADRLTEALGLRWEQRERGRERNPRWEIAGVGDDLIAEFSARTRQVEEEKDRLIASYVERHGRRPSRATIVKLRAQATLATRPEKKIRSLSDLTDEWRRRARAHLDRDTGAWARHVVSSEGAIPVGADTISSDAIRRLAAQVVDEVSSQRSTWRHWNLWAAASKQTMGWRFRTVEDREAVVAMVVGAAEERSIVLTPPELAPSPVAFRREDGTSVFRPKHSRVFSSSEVLGAEDRLLRLADDRSGPCVPGDLFHAGGLTPGQLAAISAIATSRRRLDVLVGPAGAGKTTALRGLRDGWAAHVGRGSVVGLAPSAAAAKVLGEELGVRCENTAKWLHEYDRGRTQLRRGQLVIVDEATLADTRTLDRFGTIAAVAGAKVLLVGDPAQLQSVDAGGAFSMLAQARPDVSELTDVHRFVHAWERAASLDLREGRAEAIAAYARHDRLREGTTEETLDAAYLAWSADIAEGVASILVAESRQVVDRLNARARADRILRSEEVASREVELGDGLRASIGDVVITRRNDRRLRGRSGGWVRNGDRWLITDVRTDGSVAVRRTSGLSGVVVLPKDYVADHLDLGYAVTAHRAQGVTVDTSHVVVSSRTTREDLYVAMTRGRSSNVAYVALDQPDDSHAPPESDEVTAQTVLYGVLQHSGAELSAHQTMEAEQQAWSSIAQLAAEYDTLAAVAQRDRWTELLSRSGLSTWQVERVAASSAFGPLCAMLRRTEASGRDAERSLEKAVARRSLDDADDVGAVLHRRLQLATDNRHRQPDDGFIAGLIPATRGHMPAEYESALREREHLIQARAEDLANEAVQSDAPWVRRLGPPPSQPDLRARWMREVIAVVAYRDRYQIDCPGGLGPPPRSRAQREDAVMARAALRRAVVHAASTGTTAGLDQAHAGAPSVHRC